MKFDIITNKNKDKNISNLIVNMLTYMSQIWSAKAEEYLKTKNKAKVEEMLKNICKYIESGLVEKLSYNYCVLVSESPYYALKYDNKYLMIIKYNNYEIVIIRSPFICVSGKFVKKAFSNEEKEEIKKHYEQIKDKAAKNNIQLIKFNKAILKPSFKNHLVNKEKHEKITDEFLKMIIIRNYCEIKKMSESDEKAKNKNDKNFDLANFILAIQKDISIIDDTYHWNVLGSRSTQIYSDEFPNRCVVFYHLKLIDDKKEVFDDNRLKEFDIVIFKKVPIFESVLKNILTGRLYEIEFKHLVVFFSVIIFFVIMGTCQSDYETIDKDSLGMFERNICLNKKGILGGIGILFIVSVISGMIAKKVKNKKSKSS